MQGSGRIRTDLIRPGPARFGSRHTGGSEVTAAGVRQCLRSWGGTGAGELKPVPPNLASRRSQIVAVVKRTPNVASRRLRPPTVSPDAREWCALVLSVSGARDLHRHGTCGNLHDKSFWWRHSSSGVYKIYSPLFVSILQSGSFE